MAEPLANRLLIKRKMCIETLFKIISRQSINEQFRFLLDKIVASYSKKLLKDSSTFGVNDICKFITGSSSIPLHGFDSKISILFNHGCLDGCGCMPLVSTCALSIELPIHINSLEKMVVSLERAMTEAPFFGRV